MLHYFENAKACHSIITRTVICDFKALQAPFISNDARTIVVRLISNVNTNMKMRSLQLSLIMP